MTGKNLFVFMVILCAFIVLSPFCESAEVVLQSKTLKIVIAEDGVVTSVFDKVKNVERVAGGVKAFAFTKGKKTYNCAGVERHGDKLFVNFEGTSTKARLQIAEKAGYIYLEVKGFSGEADSLTILRVSMAKMPTLGTWINTAYDDEFGVCVCAGNIKTDVSSKESKSSTELMVIARSDVAIIGTSAVAFGFNGTRDDFLDKMEVVESDLNMPSGAKNRRSVVQRYSYFWTQGQTTDNIDELIKWAKRGGFRMILFSYTSFSNSCGHYVWRSSYPNGIADLKEITDKIRAAGLAVGIHLHYNKAHLHDPYVTPVPDDRFNKSMEFTLVGDIDDSAGELTVAENPKGATLSDKRRVLKIDKELIYYTNYTTKAPFKFTGCKRGHLRTHVASHKGGADVGLLDVDTWPIFIRFDQNTDIQDESAAKLAKIINETGPYAMLYFDGAEDVHAPRWFHTTNSPYRLYKQVIPEPIVCEAAARSHFGWHLMSRSNAYDSVSSDKMKNFVRKNPVKKARRNAKNFTGVNFGWLHGFGSKKPIGPDVLEFNLSRGAAWDCPFSMTISLGQLASNPNTENCLDVTKIWEDARINGSLSQAQKDELKNLDQEHHLFINEKGEHELVAIDEFKEAADGQVKAFTFTRKSNPKDTYAILWSPNGEEDLLLPDKANGIHFERPIGKKLPSVISDGKKILVLNRRTYIVFENKSVDDAKTVLKNMKTVFGEAAPMYKKANAFSNKHDKMILLSKINKTEAGSFSDCIVCSKQAKPDQKEDWYVDYEFDVPCRGTWYLWGRVRYNTGSNSFWTSKAGDRKKKSRFGNTNRFNKWIWESGGGIRADKAGKLTVRFYAREACSNRSPLLDVVCITNQRDFEPTDKMATEALKK